MKPTASTINCLSVIPFLDHNVIQDLKAELPLYLVKAADIDKDFCPVQWWKINASELLKWSQSAMKLLLIHEPSSVAAERVFSLLNNSFGDSQYSSLQDYIEASLMLQYN